MLVLRSLLQRCSAPLAWVLPILVAAAAFAQDQPDAPPTPAISSNKPVWIGFLFIFILFGVVIAVSLFPSKRSHQD